MLSRRTSRARTQSAVKTALENLEGRVLFDATYHQLSNGRFQQDWTSTSLISANNTWTGVPSIIGYRGDDLTTATGTDPQTLLAFAGPGGPVVNVIANQTNPDTNNTGGIAEFEITNPVVAFQGSGTADAPALVIHLNTTGQTNIPVSYNLRDVDGAADNAAQWVAVQYRVGETGDFTNISEGFIADASEGPSISGLVTPVSFTLPAAAENQAQVQLRIMTTNVFGADEWIGVDDIIVGNLPPANQMQFQLTSYTVNEADGNATVTLTRTGDDLSASSTVQYATTAGGTATPGDDYTVVSGTATFAPNAPTTSFLIPIVNDIDQELAETVNLALSGPTTNGIVGIPATAVLTIVDNDTPTPTGLLVNEVEVNPPGTDQPFEYFEIRGVAGTSLNNVYAISVEGDGAAAGTADLVFNLSGNNIGSNGLAIITATTGGHTISGGTTVITTTAFDVGSTQSLENGAQSYLLVFSQSPITQASDLDTNNDGTLDLPPGAVLLDGVGYQSGAAGTVYGANITQTFTPDAITRFPNDTDALDPTAWYAGAFVAGSPQNDVNYDPLFISANAPVGAVITPGAANFGGTGGPVTATADFVFDAYPTLQTITIVFSGDVSASLDTSDITLTNITTSTVIPAGSISLAYNSGTNTASFTFPSFSNNGSLPDGNYTLSLPAANVTPNLTGDLNFSFFAFAGDANRDRAVDIGDFSTLASNFNQSPRTFSQGDFDYDGIVAIGDFSILAAKFNQTLPAPADLPRAASAALSSVFGTKKIGEDSLIDLVA